MPRSFYPAVAYSHVAHEEYPGDQCYTCGWEKRVTMCSCRPGSMAATPQYHQPALSDPTASTRGLGIFKRAKNAGLEQGKWKDLQPVDRSSRQLRGAGEVRLLQQALNFQEAHNDDLKTTAFADGIWVMFDYNRGYAPELESSGVMDIFSSA